MKEKFEKSKNKSGDIFKQEKIIQLKKDEYHVLTEKLLDGDAPKFFIRAYFFEKKSKVRKLKSKTWKYFIAKTAEKWYPHESIIEYMINLFGIKIGLNFNKVKLCRIDKQIYFLSEYFINHKVEELVHGAQICGEYIEDIEFAEEIANNVKDARELFTIQFIFKAMDSYLKDNKKVNEKIKKDFVKMLVFDAIVGNNDRHFYNWGIIRRVDKKTDMRFSPIYDTARGLLWNWDDEKIKKAQKQIKNNGKKVINYIEKGLPRVSIDGSKDINHFDLIKFIYDKYNIYRELIIDLTSKENEEKIIKLFNKKIRYFFIYERSELIVYIIMARFKKLRDIYLD